MTRRMRTAAVVLAVAAARVLTAGEPASLSVVSPRAGEEVRGEVKFAVEVRNAPGLAYVAWRLNGRDLSGPLAAAPYAQPWRSELFYDGPATVQARGYDAEGRLLAVSPPVGFIVANGPGRLLLKSPDPARVQKGIVQWTVSASRPLSDEERAQRKQRGEPADKTTEALVFFLDGELMKVFFGRSEATLDVDTARLANGPHELFVTAWAFAQGVPPFAQCHATIEVDNGAVVRELLPRWREVYLAPGETAQLAPRLLMTDGTVMAWEGEAAYASAEPKIAAVDVSGKVSAVSAGATAVTVTAQGRTATVQVVVDPPHGFGHFSRDGKLLDRYDPKRSLWVRAPFNLSPQELAGTPGLAERARAAGVNALTTGFYQNPVDGGGAKDFDAWRRGWEPWWGRIEQTAAKYDFPLVLTGDDIDRTTRELHNSVTNPWAPDAIRLAFTRARDSGRVVCVEMADEISMLWGSTPVPTDGRWAKRDPAVPDDAFVKIMAIINSVKDRPPVTWPVLGIAPPPVAANWMGDPRFSDYATQYWDIMDWRRAYPDAGGSLPQYLRSMDRAVVGRRPFMQRARPQLMLMSICGPYYVKQVEGDEFQPGRDRLIQAGVTPEAVTLEVMYAAAMGMAGVRAYAFDASWWKRERETGKIGAGGRQTGSEPFKTGTDRWQALASAFSLVGRNESWLIQPQVSAVDLGPWICTGARSGERGRLLVAASFSERAETRRVDLSPYVYAGGPDMVRCRIRGAALATETLRSSPSDEVTFEAGETIWWLFAPPAEGRDVTPPAVAFRAPMPDATLAGDVSGEIAAGDAERVDLFLDGEPVGALRPDGGRCPFRIEAARLSPGVWHGLSAVAVDGAGNVSEARIAVRTAR